MINSVKRQSEKIIFQVYDNTKCGVWGKIISILLGIALLLFFNFVVFKFYSEFTASKVWELLPEWKRFLYFWPLPLLINFIIIYSDFVLPMQMTVYENYIEICYQFFTRRINFDELKKFKVKTTDLGYVRFLWETEKEKGYCIFIFVTGDVMEGRGPDKVAIELRNILKQRVLNGYGKTDN